MNWLKGAWSAATGSVWGWLAIGAALIAFGGWAGYDLAATHCKAAERDEIQARHDQFVQAVMDGAADAKTLREQLAAQKAINARLKEAQRHVPTIAAQPVAPGCPVCTAHVTAGAAGLWNDALTGVPTSTCGADGATAEACAAATDLTPDDLAANQRENAGSCREDRLRYQRLIDHLNKRKP